MTTLPLVCVPGKEWNYGLSTDVLGHLIEKVSGTTLDKYLHRELFVPLRMNDTHFYLPPEKFDRLASVSELTVQQQVRQVPDGWQDGKVRLPNGYTFNLTYRIDAPYAKAQPRVHFSAVGGLCSTAQNYLRFCRMLANGGQLGQVRILRRETVAKMTSNQIGNLNLGPGSDWQKFGLGFGIVAGSSDALDGAYGWGGAYATNFWIHSKSDGIFIFMSQVSPTSIRNCIALGPEIKKLVESVLNPTSRNR